MRGLRLNLTTPQWGRPSGHNAIVKVTPTYPTRSPEPKTLQSQSSAYNKELCIICRKEGGRGIRNSLPRHVGLD